MDLLILSYFKTSFLSDVMVPRTMVSFIGVFMQKRRSRDNLILKLPRLTEFCRYLKILQIFLGVSIYSLRSHSPLRQCSLCTPGIASQARCYMHVYILGLSCIWICSLLVPALT